MPGVTGCSLISPAVRNFFHSSSAQDGTAPKIGQKDACKDFYITALLVKLIFLPNFPLRRNSVKLIGVSGKEIAEGRISAGSNRHVTWKPKDEGVP